MSQTQKSIREQHFGRTALDGGYFSGHTPPEAFDFYCVAHEGEYRPKYLLGAACHDDYGDNTCHPDCRLCPEPCPIEPCPIPWDDYVVPGVGAESKGEQE